MGKSRFPVSLIYLLLGIFTISTVSFGASREKDLAAIEKNIRGSIGWAINKDRPLLESVLAHDDRLFMFQPDSKSAIVGWDQFAKQFDFWLDPKFKATSFELRDLRIDLSHSGDVAWWSCVLDDLGEWDGNPIGWRDTRWTGVLEKRSGRWLIVQMHFSFAADETPSAAEEKQGTEGKEPEVRYEEMREKVVKLYGEKKFEEAAKVLEEAVGRYPDHLKANSYNLALMYVELGQLEKGVQALRAGIAGGGWYGKYDFHAPVWTPLQKINGFSEITKQSESRMLEARKKVKPRMNVVLPEGYDPGKKVPLFVALHGGGDNVDVFKPNWTSSRLKKEFIVAYLQSSLLIKQDGYSWEEDMPVSLTEIREAYERLTREYPIDTSRVVVGGFSSGGVASLDVVLNNTLPAAGFVVLCPGRPEDFSTEKVADALKRGIRGTLLTTGLDRRLEDQKQMVETMKAQGLPVEFVVTPNIGHWYPDDLDRLIDEAIGRIL